MNKVVHFEVPATDMNRAKNFYSEVFGWVPTDIPEMEYITVQTGPVDEKRMPKEAGFISGGLMEKKGEFQHPVITIDVESIEDAAKRIKEHGGELIVDKMEVGDMGFAAYFKDSEGNMMGLWQNKAS